MADFPSDRTVARPERDAWQHDNDRGLSLAEAGDWAEATEAFASAADCLARSLPDGRALTGESHHEPLALVLGNLAQACFRLGHMDEALRHAQRACALRVAITGEDGMPVARARMDLAVMLASSGRLDEATALIQRAIAGIEHRVGEEDERLAPVLENAARIALASGRPANAEPLLLRLHALLDAHDRSTASADLLLAQVAEVRAQPRAAVASPVIAPEIAPEIAPVIAPEIAPVIAPERAVAAAPEPVPAAIAVTTPVSSAYVDGFDDASTRVYAHATIADLADWEDQPLRDAVAMTDHLLRTTPTGVPIVPASALLEPPDLAVNDETLDDAEALLDTMDFTDVLPAPSLQEPVTELLLSVDPVVDAPAYGGASMAGNALRDHLTPLEPFDALDGLDLLEPASPLDAMALDLTDDGFPGATADAEPTRLPEPEVAEAEVVAITATEPIDSPIDAPIDMVIDTLVPTPTAAPALLPDNGLLLDFAVEHGMAEDEASLVQRPPISLPVPDMHEPAVTRGPEVAVEPRLVVVTAGSSRGIAPIDNMVPTAPPLPDSDATATAPARPAPTPAGGQRPVRRTPESRVVLPAPTESKGKGGLIAIMAAVVAAGGTAAFFLLR